MNYFSIDLEDWYFEARYQSFYKSYVLSRPLWIKQSIDENFDANIEYLLNLFDEFQTKITFFTLGAIARKRPDILQLIKSKGHEIASHGYDHKPLNQLTDIELCRDLENSIEAIYVACGSNPVGYRAPNFSIGSNNANRLGIIRSAGFLYDSSMYPISIHPAYGCKDFTSSIHRRDDNLVEFPITTYRFAKLNIPCGGGAYLRYYPYKFYSYLLNSVVARGRDLVLYFHPWELGDTLPFPCYSLLPKFRRRFGISGTKLKLWKLLQSFEFHPFRDYFDRISSSLVFGGCHE